MPGDDIQWLPDENPHPVAIASTTDVIQSGPRRRVPRRWWIAIVSVLAAVAAAITTVDVLQRTRAPSAELVARRDALVALAQRVSSAPSLERIVLSGPSTSCRPASVGNPVGTRVTAAVQRRLAGYSGVDVSENYEAGSSLCAATVRLRNTSGALLIVIVETPPNPVDGTLFLTRSEPTGDIRALSEVSADGWRIVIGASGARADFPSRSDLEAIAADPNLTW